METQSSESGKIFDQKIISIRKINSFESNIKVTSIRTSDNRHAWLMDQDRDTMYLYSDNGEVVRSVTVTKGVGINDMVITPSGEMVVTNGDQKVRCVSGNGDMTTLIDTAPFSAHGVCLTDKGEIVVCMSDQVERNHVAVYSSDGRKKLREIKFQDAQGKQLIIEPWRVIQNGEDLCVVEEKYVVCIDESGGVRWMYDAQQAKMKGRFYPVGICKDMYHNLLITDMLSNCVHYIDREGQLIKIILTFEQTGIQGHWGISVDDETSQVWIGNALRNVAVVKYLQ